MVVQVGEQLPVRGELFLQPGALFRGQVFEHLSGAIPVNLAHDSRIPVPGMDDHSGHDIRRSILTPGDRPSCSASRRLRAPQSDLVITECAHVPRRLDLLTPGPSDPDPVPAVVRLAGSPGRIVELPVCLGQVDPLDSVISQPEVERPIGLRGTCRSGNKVDAIVFVRKDSGQPVQTRVGLGDVSL